jgi:hypothetical protein
VPEFQAVTLTNNTLGVTGTAEAGGSYQLQYNSDMSSSTLSLSNPITATRATLNTADSITKAVQRFYRLVLSRGHLE